MSDNIEDLIDTKPIDELNDQAIEEAVETSVEEVKTEIKEELKEEKKNNIFKRIKDGFNSLPKKKKILLIVTFVLLLALAVVLLIVLLDKDEEKPESKVPVEETIVVEDNYKYIDGKLTFLDAEGNEFGSYECTNKDENLCYVAYVSSEDEFDSSKKVFEDGTPVKVRTKIYEKKYVFIYDNEKEENGLITLYNIEDQKEEDIYQIVKSYNISEKNYVVLKNTDGKYGLIELSGEGIIEVISFSYDFMGIYEDQTEDKYVAVQKDSKWYLIDYDENVKSKQFNNMIVGYKDGYLKTRNKDNYSVYSFENKELASGCSYAYLFDEYYFCVNSDNELFGKDYENNKLNEQAIDLNNKEYVVTNIYTEDGVKIDSTFAAMFTFSENSINVGVYDGTTAGEVTTINLEEVNLNKNNQFYNYLDGTLYFYEDEEKEELIGSYKCGNKNSDLTNGFVNCLPASDDVDEVNAMIPIYNNKFVFIKDSIASESEKEIVLYDLVNSKEIGSYKSVNTQTAENGGKLTHAVKSSVIVIAQSKKTGNYGVIEIGSEDVSSVYDFNYTSLEFLDEYMLVQTSGGKWKLLGKSIAEFDDKIIDYNAHAILTKGNNRYAVYDLEGNQIVSYKKHIELLDNYIVSVNDSDHLSLHTYNGDSVIENVLLESQDYIGEQPAYKISSANGLITVSVLIEGAYVDYKYDSVTGELVE